MKGLFIPDEILDMDLNITECAVLSIYKYFTEKGDRHCCTLLNEDICRKVKINERKLQRIKKHLKELGYIRTDGGIRVYYLSSRGDTSVTPGVTKLATGVTPASPPGDKTDTPGVTKLVVRGDTSVAHNKEEKRKKEIKKEEKGMRTNFEWLVELLPEDYKTQEKIDYIKKKYEVIINNLEVDSASMDLWVVRLKTELNKEYPMEYKTPIKKEEVSDTIDLF